MLQGLHGTWFDVLLLLPPWPCCVLWWEAVLGVRKGLGRLGPVPIAPALTTASQQFPAPWLS